jgi:hypothetical protein
MFRLTDDPLTDYDAHEAEEQAALALLPECNNCGFPITDGHYYDINGTKMCLCCLENCKVYID